jgi:CheY-like chemotaxis protein
MMNSREKSHIVFFMTDPESDRLLINVMKEHFKTISVVDKLKGICKLLVDKIPKIFLITGESMSKSLASYYRSLDAVSEYEICDHRIVSLIPRKYEKEAYNAFRSGVIDDYLVARPVYEIHRVILICEHLLIELGITINIETHSDQFVEQIVNIPSEIKESIFKGMERKATIRFEFESCMAEIDDALDLAAEKFQRQQPTTLDFIKLKETLSAIRSDEIRPELLQLQQKAMTLLATALDTNASEETEQQEPTITSSNISEKVEPKPKQSYSFNRLYHQDVDPESLLNERENIPSILVVEDDIISLQLTQRLLKSLTLKLDIAQTGRKAFASVTSQHYDLILMDVILPDTNGIYIVDQISNGDGINRDTPIIMLSGNSDKNTVSEAIQRGAKGFIIKPLYKESIKKLFTKYNIPCNTKSG